MPLLLNTVLELSSLEPRLRNCRRTWRRARWAFHGIDRPGRKERSRRTQTILRSGAASREREYPVGTWLPEFALGHFENVLDLFGSVLELLRSVLQRFENVLEPLRSVLELLRSELEPLASVLALLKSAPEHFENTLERLENASEDFGSVLFLFEIELQGRSPPVRAGATKLLCGKLPPLPSAKSRLIPLTIRSSLRLPG